MLVYLCCLDMLSSIWYDYVIACLSILNLVALPWMFYKEKELHAFTVPKLLLYV